MKYFSQNISLKKCLSCVNNTAASVDSTRSLITIGALNCTLTYLCSIFASVSCFSSKQELSAPPVTVSLFSFTLGAHFVQQGVSTLISGTLFVPDWASSLQREWSRKPHVPATSYRSRHWQDDHVPGEFIRPRRGNCELTGHNIIIQLFYDNIVETH